MDKAEPQKTPKKTTDKDKNPNQEKKAKTDRKGSGHSGNGDRK